MAAFVFGTDSQSNRRRILYLVDNGGLPHFRLAGQLCGRKSTILSYIAEQERKSVCEEAA
ncbi:hypothetical protein OPKNFCMD_5234 [Methylobacterium crusticola]|uniref:DNA-binding protein n=1 Tax=Methylobacterium crusticola TaxID=1697972 RepID=A0ABQ4R4A0_9HYPH|nr:hypothetical protein OPKNFCMD_5234 [Methylobacterium crusticola]